MTWQNRIVGHGERNPLDLLAHPNNTKIHPLIQQQAMDGVLNELGWCDEVKITEDDTVVDGHLRVAVAIAKKEMSIPVAILNLSPAETEYAILTFDPIGAIAEQDKHKLEALLQRVTSCEPAVQQLLDDIATKAGIVPGEIVELTEEKHLEPETPMHHCPHCGFAFRD